MYVYTRIHTHRCFPWSCEFNAFSGQWVEESWGITSLLNGKVGYDGYFFRHSWRDPVLLRYISPTWKNIIAIPAPFPGMSFFFFLLRVTKIETWQGLRFANPQASSRLEVANWYLKLRLQLNICPKTHFSLCAGVNLHVINLTCNKDYPVQIFAPSCIRLQKFTLILIYDQNVFEWVSCLQIIYTS